MTTQRISPQTFKSIAGSVLVAPGLFLLCGDLDGVLSRCHQSLAATSDLGILSSVILAASVSPMQLLQGLLHVLWAPFLLVSIGSLLLWNASRDAREVWPTKYS